MGSCHRLLGNHVEPCAKQLQNLFQKRRLGTLLKRKLIDRQSRSLSLCELPIIEHSNEHGSTDNVTYCRP